MSKTQQPSHVINGSFKVSAPSSNGPKRLGVAQPFLVRRQWKRFLPLGTRTGEARWNMDGGRVAIGKFRRLKQIFLIDFAACRLPVMRLC